MRLPRLARALWVMATDHRPESVAPSFRVHRTEHGDLLEDIYR